MNKLTLSEWISADAETRNDYLEQIIADARAVIEEQNRIIEWADSQTSKAEEPVRHSIQWLDGRNGVEVHAPGCKDLRRQITVLDTPSDVEEWASAEDFAKDFNSDFYDEGADHEDGLAGCHPITFYPCTGLVSKKSTIKGY